MSSTGCVDGDAVGVVYKIGDQTFIGRIATLASVTKEVETTLQKEIKHVVHTIAKLGFTMACIFFIIGMARGGSFIPTFINGFVVVLIANVPEGLPMTVTSCLTITAKRMAEHNVFIKRLQSVETLGSATTIASDKTGTLTMNVMTVANVWYDSVFKSAVEVGRTGATLGGSSQQSPTYRLLEIIAGVNNTAYFEDAGPGSTPISPEKHEELHHTLTKKSSMAPEVLAHIQKKAAEQRMAEELKGKKSSKASALIAKSATRPVIGDASDTVPTLHPLAPIPFVCYIAKLTRYCVV
jgi:magnesium-transporting ATPase (P-type)